MLSLGCSVDPKPAQLVKRPKWDAFLDVDMLRDIPYREGII